MYEMYRSYCSRPRSHTFGSHIPEKVAKKDFDDDVKSKVDACWDLIHQQSLKHYVPSHGQDACSLKGWKTVRVFVSSTFTDMHNEREILIKKVFPALREWCEQRKFTLIECDLRWGVPKDSTFHTIISTCMEEIDRCLEDNDNMPFFVNLLSERYGWIPTDADVPGDIYLKYKWISNLSITHMEILHGAFRFGNPNALFCLRDSTFVKHVPSDKLSSFVDQDAFSQCQLKVLKENIVNRFPGQVFVYECQVDGLDRSTGREKVKLVGLQPLADKVLQFLCSAIEKQYPAHHLAPDVLPVELEEMAHCAFMQSKAEFVVGRNDEIDALYKYVATQQTSEMLEVVAHMEDDFSTSLANECSSFGVDETDNKLVAVIGATGLGKSALLAKLALIASTAGLNVLYHSVGCSFDSLSATSVVYRFMVSLSVIVNEEEFRSLQYEQLRHKMTEVLAEIRLTNKQLVFIIDGLDGMADNDSTRFLDWLPPRFPKNICCLVSCRDNHRPCIARLASRDSYLFNIKELTTAGAVCMVEQYLGRFNKRLDVNQLSSLVQHKSVTVPLWLSIASEEMRVFGDFATITDKIKNFPDGLHELAKDVLQRLLDEDETHCLEKLLALIYCSPDGLPEKTVLHLLGDLSAEEAAPMIVWATCRRYLKPFIRITVKGSHEAFRIQMLHEIFYKAVKDLILSDEYITIKWHTYIADYLQYHCSDDLLVAEDLPQQLTKAGLWLRLKEFYRSDIRSNLLSAYKRASDLNKIRCQKFIHRSAPHLYSACVICSQCAYRSRLLTVNSFPTRDVCAICGNWTVHSTGTAMTAVLCREHHGFNSTITKCFLCQRNIILQNGLNTTNKMYEEMHLCLYCCMGKGSLLCCHLLDSNQQ